MEMFSIGIHAMSKAKFVSAAEAVKLVPDGGTVFLGSGCGEPQTLVEALLEAHEQFNDVTLITGLQGSKAPYIDSRYGDRFHLRTFVSTRGIRQAIHDGRAEYVPVPLSRIPRLFRDGTIPLDVAFIQVSSP